MHIDHILISTDLKSALADFFSQHNYTAIAVIVDENTHEHCYPLVRDFLPEHIVIEIKSGEEEKNLTTCHTIWSALTNNQFDRKGLVINLGGGVIGDMGGFAAATYKRGVEFMNLPTTLLAQVDASVGGKLGIDFDGFKNHIGMFKNPERVFINVDFLKTLSAREVRSGYAEVIKHALIADATYWPILISRSFDTQDFGKHVKHSVMVKRKVVTDDPEEKGYRKILNFGHTIGHAVETKYLTRETGRLLHGEAIAIGMIAESFLSTKLTALSQSEMNEIVDYIMSVYDCQMIVENDFEEIVQNTYQDKKNVGKIVKASLLSEIGTCEFDIAISKEDVLESLDFYNQKVKQHTVTFD